jgi:hypothetical protein
VTDPVIRLDSDRVAVEPGGQAQVGVTISNPGSIVEGYQLDVVGEGPASWAQVIPPELSVYPQQEARAIVTFSPPSGNSAPSGTSAFGVRARSTVDPDTSAVAEGDVEIGKVFGLQAKIVPVTSSGRWRGRHVVQLSNWGNSPATLRMVASDPDAALGFYVRPDVIELPLGGSATVRMSVKTRKPFLRGSAVRLPFTVVGERADAGATASPTSAMAYADPSRPVVDGAFNQKPILSAGLVTLLGLVLVAIIGLSVWLVTRPRDGGPGLGAAGPPPKPVIIAVEPTGPDAVRVLWEPIDGLEKYELLKNEDGQTVEQVVAEPDLTALPVKGLVPRTTYCYQLVAVRGGVKSVKSDEKCGRTDPAPPTASPSPGSSGSAGSTVAPPPTEGASPGATGPPPTEGQPTDSDGPTPVQPTTAAPADPRFLGKWVAVADLVPVGAAAQPRVDRTLAKLEEIQPRAEILRSADYPNLKDQFGRPVSISSLLVAVGPFDTVQQARDACPQITAATGDPTCLLYQPQP